MSTEGFKDGVIMRKRVYSLQINGDATNGSVVHNGGDDGARLDSPAAKRFQELLQGLDAPGDSGNPPVPPPWLDRELFNKGREFYRRYFFCVFLSDLVALLMLFTVNRILRPLMYTGRSDTSSKALRRYVSTINHVITWFSGDVWDANDPAHKDIMQVRQIHQTAARIFNSAKNQEKVDGATVATSGDETPSCPFNMHARKDLQGRVGPGVPLETHPTVYISQWDQMFTQYAFMGVLVAHPWRMGAWWVTDEEMEGFIHFWRGAGWLLGIEDHYNFCSGNLEETRALCSEMERQIVKPSLGKAGKDHEVMGTALVDGLSSVLPWFSYPAVLKFLADALDLSLPSVSASMSVRHKFHYVFLRVVTHGLFLVPGVVRLFNVVLQMALRVVQGQHPRWKPKVTVTPYSY